MSWTRAGAALMFLAVALGAFGAHGLRSRLEPRALEIWETAVRYQVYHALALLVVKAALPNWLFVGGIALFSGSLYLLALTGVKWLGAITPLGGLLFLAGWLVLALKS